MELTQFDCVQLFYSSRQIKQYIKIELNTMVSKEIEKKWFYTKLSIFK